ncbi:MAG TPA: hypothetical protein VGY57_05195 [Vicinamibacterales bacterium]|nr:hypothetical protein [Vicinamibacterales bacterium]
MVRSTLVAFILFALVVLPRPIGAEQGDERLAGTWTLNRSLSEFPRELGFSPEWLDAGAPSSTSGGGAGSTGGGRGGRGSRGGSTGGSGSGFGVPRESADDAMRKGLLTAEVRNPPARLTIVDTPSAITMTDENGASRTFHPVARDEPLPLDNVNVVVSTRREGDRVVITFNVEEGRQLRYTYSTTTNPRQLNVDVEFVEKRATQKIHRVYDVAAIETAAPAAPGPKGPGLQLPAGPKGPGPQPQPEAIDQRPDAQLRGLKTLGFVVEELSPQAAACGLKRDALDASLAKRLTDAGFTVRRQSDEDTHVYININTTTATISPTVSLCVSRYDAFLYTHTAAKLSHTSMPVLVQVSLLHDGGLAGGTASAHAAGVQKGLEGIIDSFASRIHDANK